MNTATINVTTTPATKAKAQKVAQKLGVSLSTVVDQLLKQFIKTKQFNNRIEQPTEYLLKSLKKSEEDERAGKVISFNSGKDALKYLAKELEDEKRAAH